MADFIKGDVGTKLRVTFIGPNGEILNLTDYDVKLKYRIGSTVYPTKTMTVIAPASDGVAEYNFATDELGNEGIMYAEIELESTVNDNVISNADPLIFTVRGKTTV